VLAEGGFTNVQTYIQSGNAIVESDLSPRQIETRIHGLIAEHIDTARVFFVLFAERPPTVSGTMRNVNTLSKLAAWPSSR
jgi:uncharacterized protein (DUF1697 family)